MIPDIHRKTLNFILYEASRFNVRGREAPSQYSNYFAVELTWDDDGVEKKQVFTYFSDYRMWYMRHVVHKRHAETHAFWEAMKPRKKDDPDNSK